MSLRAISINRMIMSYLLAAYCMLLPFEEILAFSFGSLLRPLGALIMGLSFIFLIPNRFRVSRYWLWMLAWLLICAASVLWSRSFDWWSYYFKIYLGQAVFVFMIAHLPSEYINLRIVKTGMLIGALAAAIILIFLPSQTSYTDEGRRTIIMLGSHMDPNILATIMCIAVFCAFSRFDREKNTIHKAVIALIVLILVAGIFLTGSRGAVISLAAAVLLMIALFMMNGNYKRRTVYILLAVAAALVIIFFVLPDDLLMNRFSSDTLLGLNEYNNKVHNRYTIWQNALKVFIQKPFFGWGCGNFLSAIDIVYRSSGAHSIVVLELVEMGVIGTFPLFAYLTKLAIRVRKYSDIITFCMLVSVYITAMTLDTLSNKYFWITLMIVSVSVKQSIGGETE